MTSLSLSSSPSADANREIRFEHSRDLADLLSTLNASILVSTYQAGKLVAFGANRGCLSLSFHNFDRPMGMAVDHPMAKLAVAAKDKVWLLRSTPDIAPRLEPAGSYDSCLLTRQAHVTGEIQAHEMSWAGDELWVVNTLFSCLCTLDSHHSFVPRWQPPFVTALAPEDRCHLNGLAMVDGKPKYVTAMAESNEAAGWRPRKAETGCLVDVESGETMARGFAMPHSPRVHAGRVWLLDSGRGQLVQVDPTNGQWQTVARFPGYTRGLAIHGTTAFVGLSRIRETSTFGGVPIAEQRERLKCGIAIVDLPSGRLLGQFEFKTGVEELFDVVVLPRNKHVAIRGPFASEDGAATLWTVPIPEKASIPRAAPGRADGHE
jgi:uncharacterized protein (TIGR03032 family)